MKIFLLGVLLLFGGSAGFAQDDPVIMTIAGHPVSRSEFEYSYNKNNSEGVIDKKSVKDYVDLFIDYKLKVQAALDAHLDTLTSFKKEFLSYRDQQIRPSFLSDQDVENEARKIYRNTQERIDQNGGMLKVAHILIRVGQKASKEEEDAAEKRADSLYSVLKKGASFSDLARRYSQDPGSASKGGELPWMVKGQAFKEFENAAWNLKPGEVSQPVLSPAGYHLILLKAKQPFLPYDSVKTDIHRFIEARGIREQLINLRLDSLAKVEQVDKESILTHKSDELSSKDADLKNLIREYHDGLLLFEMSNRVVWDKAAKDEIGLSRYFKQHRKNYKWDQPRFKGIAYHMKNREDIRAVRQSVKGKPFKEWAQILRTTFNKDSVIRIRVEKGIFKEGENALVDKEVFKKDTVVKAMKDYPYEATFGKLLKKGPEDYEDVRAQVVADYQDELEKEWVKALRRKYTFEVYPAVLATVNQHNK